MAKHIRCAGLTSGGLNSTCQRRDNCCHFVPWPNGGTDFNACAGQAFKHFKPLRSASEVTAQKPEKRPQLDLFA